VVYSAVVTTTIEPHDLLARIGSKEDGAVLLFLGTVRDHAGGRAVDGMRYDAYREMAESVLAEVASEAAQRLGTDRVAVMHRIGELELGDVSVAIAVSSPHRAESYEASRYVIEEIKKRLPVWKKERYSDGGAEWVAGAAPPGTGSSLNVGAGLEDRGPASAGDA